MSDYGSDIAEKEEYISQNWWLSGSVPYGLIHVNINPPVRMKMNIFLWDNTSFFRTRQV